MAMSIRKKYYVSSVSFEKSGGDGWESRGWVLCCKCRVFFFLYSVFFGGYFFRFYTATCDAAFSPKH